MAQEKVPKSVGVHDGAFHADEVTACALLILSNLATRDRIVRTRDPQKLATCAYVCDVGGIYDPARGLFDHHQVEYQGELSSAGMVLRYLEEQKILSTEEARFLDDYVIRGVDAHDNGRITHELGTCTFSHIIAGMMPVSYDATDSEKLKAFYDALDFALGHLGRLRERFHYEIECRKTVKEVMERFRTCLMFDRAIPWLDSFFALGGADHSALFVIMPAGPHWKLRGIPPDAAHRMQVRVPLPQEWAGLLEEELKQATGIPGAIFCHKGRFTSVWEAKEDAERALKLALEKQGIANEDII